MRLSTITSASALALLLAASPVGAQNRWTAEVRGGANVNANQFATADLKTGIGVGGALGVRILPDLFAYGGWDWQHHGAKTPLFGVGAHVEDTGYAFGLSKSSMTKSNIHEKRSLVFNLIDFDKNITYVPNLYNITILKSELNNGKVTENVFLNGSFISKNGTLTLEFVSNETKNVNKNNHYVIDKGSDAQEHNQAKQVIRADENGIILVDKPKLDSGMYRLKVNVALPDPTDLNENVYLKFDSYLSLGNILDLVIGNPHKKITILSFNDKIVNYDYDQQSKKISFKFHLNTT